MSSAEYDCVQKSSLKLKGVDEKAIKKKKKKSKKKSKDRDRESEEAASAIAASTSSRQEEDDDDNGEEEEGLRSKEIDRRLRGKTKSEIAFLKRQFKLEEERLKGRVALTHKEKVEKFNSYLETLSEHYEQAKVSWTK